MVVHFWSRWPLGGIAILVLCAVSLADDKLTIKKLRALEHQLVATEKSLEAYRRFLTQPNISKQDKEIAEARIGDLESLAKQGVWIIGGKKLTPKEIEAKFSKSEALIAEAIKIADSSAPVDAEKKIAEASKVNPASFKADFLMGLYAARVSKDFKSARLHFEESVERGRALRAVWGTEGETNFLHALNNVALTKIRDDKLEDSYRLWSEALQLRPKPPAEILHNIAYALRYMEIAKGGPVLKVTDGTLKKFREMVDSIGGNSASGTSTRGWIYLGFSPGRTIGNYVEESSFAVQDSELATIFSSTVVDNACLVCDGKTGIMCPNKCANGVVAVQSYDEFVDPFGNVKRVPKSYGVPCTQCGGKGVIDCPACSDGSEQVDFGSGRRRN